MSFIPSQSLAAASSPRRLVRRLLLLGCFCCFTTTSIHAQQQQQQHQENYAVIVSSSRYWFNYRHTVNALTVYQNLKTHGQFTDDRIILMLADEYAVNPRNPYKNYMTSSSAAIGGGGTDRPSSSSLYRGEEIEIDYRGEDVTVENLMRVLAGKSPASPHDAAVGGPPVIPADASRANLFVYLTGHGGDSFFKFQDVEEILAADLAAAFRQRSFHRVLFMADTCQAFTLGDRMEDIPDVIVIGSSLRDESSYAHHSNADLGLASIERYTHAVDQFLNHAPERWHALSLYDALVAPYSYESQRAHIGMRPSPTTVRDGTSQPVVADFWVNRQRRPAETTRPWSSKSMWKNNRNGLSDVGIPPRTYHNKPPTRMTWETASSSSSSGSETAPDIVPLLLVLLFVSIMTTTRLVALSYKSGTTAETAKPKTD